MTEQTFSSSESWQEFERKYLERENDTTKRNTNNFLRMG